MPGDILSDYGKDVPHADKPRATSGGVMPVRDVRGYSPPQGPSNINDAKSPGLHGHNYGTGQKPIAGGGEGGSPGIHGSNKGVSGSQK